MDGLTRPLQSPEIPQIAQTLLWVMGDITSSGQPSPQMTLQTMTFLGAKGNKQSLVESLSHVLLFNEAPLLSRSLSLS
jgi:hypothetical protein